MYVLLASLNAALGLVALLAPRTGTLLFLALLLIVPSSPAFDSWDYLNGLYAFDFFFLVLLATFPYRAMMRRQPASYLRALALLVFLIATSAIGLLAADRPLDKYALRDLRPFLLIAEGLILLLLLEREKIAFSVRGVLWLGIAAGFSCFFGFGLIQSGVFQVTNVFYEENAFRYLAIGSYMCAALLLWLAANAGRAFRAAPMLAAVAVTAAGGAVILAGVRALIFATVVGSVAAGPLRAKRIVLSTLIGAVLVAGFAYVSVELGVERVTAATSAEGIAAQFANRFGPAFNIMAEMQWWEWIVGTGMGTTFEIPWFEYQGLDPRNNFVDSAYITMAVKWGASALLYAWLLSRACGVGRLPRPVERALLVCLLLLGVTMAIPYQKFALGFPVFYAFLSRVSAPIAKTRRRVDAYPQFGTSAGVRETSTQLVPL
jgi:hypothetical protein